MTRQAADPAGISCFRATRLRGEVKAMHAHPDAQLTFVVSGVMQILTAAGRWLVPPQLAVWAPAGVAHQIEVLSDVEALVFRFPSDLVRDWAPSRALGRAFALRVTPLLRVLGTEAMAADIAAGRTELILRLMLQDLIETPDAPTFLPLPASPAGRRVADLALEDTRNRLSVAELASRAATSVRSLSRVFPAETGMTFKAWRQRARIVRAIDQLSAGRAVARVSAEAGFASTAAFSFAFRQVTAMTPTAFLSGQPMEAGAAPIAVPPPA